MSRAPVVYAAKQTTMLPYVNAIETWDANFHSLMCSVLPGETFIEFSGNKLETNIYI